MVDFIVQAATDNVGVALRDLSGGNQTATGRALREGTTLNLNLLENIPAGHKVALYDIDAGASVFRNGADIGVLTSSVRKGCLIHTHNLKTRRW